MNTSPFQQVVSQWVAVRCLHKRQKTVQLYNDVQRLILRYWREPDKPAGIVTADDVISLAQLFSGQCVTRWNLMVACLRYVTPHGKLLKRRPVKIREFTPPSQKQFADLLAECDRNRRTSAGLVIRFLCYTGLRIGEARALTWGNVGVCELVVPASVTKNGRQRIIPFVPGLADVLERLANVTGSEEHILPRANCRKALERVTLRVLGVQWSHHLCRHFFATRCIQSGVDMPTVARWLGHSDGGALLARTYFHLSDGHSRSMAQRVRV